MRVWMILGLAVVTWGLQGCATAPTAASGSAPKEGCDSPLGFIPEGGSAPGYLHQTEQGGDNCQQGTLTCQDGTWTGAYIFPTCTRVLIH